MSSVKFAIALFISALFPVTAIAQAPIVQDRLNDPFAAYVAAPVIAKDFKRLGTATAPQARCATKSSWEHVAHGVGNAAESAPATHSAVAICSLRDTAELTPVEENSNLAASALPFPTWVLVLGSVLFLAGINSRRPRKASAELLFVDKMGG